MVRWWHCQRDTSSDRTPLARMLPSVIGSAAGERGRALMSLLGQCDLWEWAAMAAFEESCRRSDMF
jgi:hypothetical protein